MDNLNTLKIVNKFKSMKVVVLGDVMLDVYDFCYTSNSRPSPERDGKLVYKADKSLRTLGGAGNVASNLSSLGVSSVLISVCGKDGHYFSLEELADKQNIHHFFIRDNTRPTTTKTRLYIDDEYMLRRDDEDASKISPEISASIMAQFLREIKGADAVIISDYNKGLFTKDNAPKFIEACKELNVPVIVDFKPSNVELFRNASVIGPNRKEAAEIIPEFESEDLSNPDVRLNLMDKIYKELKSDHVLVTLGSEGICAYDGNTLHHSPAQTLNVVDTVGCGDTVRAVFALAWSSGLSMQESLDLANISAGIVIQKLGTASISTLELQAALKNYQCENNKLEKIVANA